MRAFSAATAALAIVLALVGWLAISTRDQSLDRAGDAADQLISVQRIRSAVIEADSIATTTFLAPGLAEAEQGDRFESRLSAATGGLALLADGGSATARASITSAATLLSQFSGLIEQARSNNRQGFPVGAAYQRQASSLVRNELREPLIALEQQARSDVNDNIASAHRIGWLLPAAGLVVLAAMGAGGWWLFRRTRRLLNVPLTVAAAITLVVVGFGLSSMADSASAADAAIEGDLLVADRYAQATVAAFQARSDEALTLINRGNGLANETDFQEAQSLVDAVLDERTEDSLLDSYDDYAAQHNEIRALDDAGGWDAAVDLLRGDSAAAFDSFSSEIDAEVQTRAGQARADLDDAGSGLSSARWAVLVGALVAAGLVAIGYGQRLREYR